MPRKKTPPAVESCSICRFFVPVVDYENSYSDERVQRRGICRRYPNRIYTPNHEWCGEFAKAEVPDAAE